MRRTLLAALVLLAACGQGTKVTPEAEPVEAQPEPTFPDIPIICIDPYGHYIGPIIEDPAEVDEPAEQAEWVDECRAARGLP